MSFCWRRVIHNRVFSLLLLTVFLTNYGTIVAANIIPGPAAKRHHYVDDVVVRDVTSSGWQKVTSGHSAGATLMTQYNSVERCQDACVDDIENCVAVDVDARIHDVVSCWVHSDVSDLDVMYHEHGLNQFRLTSRAEFQTVCSETGAVWRLHSNQNSFYGSPIYRSTSPPVLEDGNAAGIAAAGGWTLMMCMDACIVDDSCLAVDFEEETTACYVHRDGQFSETRGPYNGVHQLELVKRCKPGEVLTTKRTTARPSSTSTSTFTPTTQPMTDTTTTTTTTIPTITRAPTTTTTRYTTSSTILPTPQHVLPNPGCRTSWVLNPHTHSPGGLLYTPSPRGAQQFSLESCLDYCKSLRGPRGVAAAAAGLGGCLAVDVDTATSPVSCWVHQSVSALTRQYRRPGCMQYVMVSCPLQQDSHLCFPEYTTKQHDDVTQVTQRPRKAVHDACGTSCLPAWLRHPDISLSSLSQSATVTSSAVSDCLEHCIRQPECRAVDVIHKDEGGEGFGRRTVSRDGKTAAQVNASSPVQSAVRCLYHESDGDLPTRQPGVLRYQLLDHCATECAVRWTMHTRTRFQLKRPQSVPYHVTDAMCAAICRLNPNCAIYELHDSSAVGDVSVTSSCRWASEFGVEAVRDESVTSYTRTDTKCLLKAFKCEASWLTMPDVAPAIDDDVTVCNGSTLRVASVGQCLDRCLAMTSPGCIGVAVRRHEVGDDVMHVCRLLTDESQLIGSRDSPGNEIYVLQNHCYVQGSQSTRHHPSEGVLVTGQQQLITIL